MLKQDRISWAVSMLDVQPADHLLEIGCGAGAAITLVGALLTLGSITAVDRSKAMIDKAARRNEAFIKSGQLSFCVGEFREVVHPRPGYDKIFAFNVNIFLGAANSELAIIQEHLSPEGALYLFFQPPPTTDMKVIQSMAEKARAGLRAAGFHIVSTTFKKLHPAPACCIVARPNQ